MKLQLKHHLALLLMSITPALARGAHSTPAQPNGSIYNIGTNDDLWAWRKVKPRSEATSDVELACDLFLSRGADPFLGMSKEECIAAMGGFVKETRKGKAEGEWVGELENLVVGLEGKGKGSKTWF